MWAEDIDDITVEYEEGGVQVIRQEAKEIIARGTWPVLVFRYREWDPASESYGPAKFTLRKFRKQHGSYRMESKFNIGSPAQALSIAGVLQRWASEAGAAEDPGDSQGSRAREKKV